MSIQFLNCMLLTVILIYKILLSRSTAGSNYSMKTPYILLYVHLITLYRLSPSYHSSSTMVLTFKNLLSRNISQELSNILYIICQLIQCMHVKYITPSICHFKVQIEGGVFNSIISWGNYWLEYHTSYVQFLHYSAILWNNIPLHKYTCTNMQALLS